MNTVAHYVYGLAKPSDVAPLSGREILAHGTSTLLVLGAVK